MNARAARRVVAALLFAALAASPVHAQKRPRSDRFWVSVSAGVQTAAPRFDDEFDLTLYTEKEHITADYPNKSGLLIAASGGYRLWKRLSIGLGVTHASARGNAKVTAALPHPLLDNTFRTVEGTARTSRNETGAHLMFGMMLPLSKKMRLLLNAGPSVLGVQQAIVTEVTFSETYPYDSAIFTGVKTNRGSRAAAGVNSSADVFWLFSKNAGAGALVQFTRASVRANAGAGRSVTFDAGGVQAGAGLRFTF